MLNKVKVGQMRKRLTLQQNVPQTKDGFSQPVDSWQPVATVYAKVEPISGREFFNAAQIQADVTHRITVRYRPDFLPTAAWRGLLGTRVFSFVSVRDVEERHIEWEIMAVEAPPQAVVTG